MVIEVVTDCGASSPISLIVGSGFESSLQEKQSSISDEPESLRCCFALSASDSKEEAKEIGTCVNC